MKVQNELKQHEEIASTQGAMNPSTLRGIPMSDSLAARLVRATIFGLVLVIGPLSLATAATQVFPAGQACKFDLYVDSTGGNQHYKEFLDKQGKPVRTLLAGVGSQLTFTNPTNNATYSFKGNGSVLQTTNNTGGSQTVTTGGHNVIILYPTDVPAGPTTTLYVGRVVYQIDAAGNWTIQGTHGNSTDICALLSS
ncbi:hypothetical protein [Variovorax ginsengisoli]|uniref:Uncharacterized protein n=1 Tax=Variovorax ginsengisoli TaxID=363844 RepID=A0ABT8SB99_9BURK|nr:hypothetical protein [Variovorax ginsengisoli]MDN8616543.1 hypothetical protein [Variovorax ginsengisoli]MDO1535713.1 hypothetical protein [Variovorax ginsengisoli]